MDMIPNPRFTMVVCSCDSYEDTWDPFFTLLKRYWPEFSGPVVLNTETKTYVDERFSVVCPRLYLGHPDPASIPWSRRLRETLEQIVKTELVMLFLDDFYLRSPPNTQKLDICLQLIERDQTIANILLFSCPQPYSPTQDYPWLLKRSKKAPYIFSLQAGLWRKERLLHFLREHESPWYFERWGSLRARRYPDDFYAVAAVEGKQSIFDYCPSIHGLSKGLWLSQTGELFQQEGISVDLSRRGTMPIGWKSPQRRRNWLKTGWNIFRSLRP